MQLINDAIMRIELCEVRILLKTYITCFTIRNDLVTVNYTGRWGWHGVRLVMTVVF
jgi:hypothetical protein